MPPQDSNHSDQPIADIQTPPEQNLSSSDIPSLPASMTMEKTKRHLPLLPILSALVVAVAIIGLTAFVFIEAKYKNKPQPTSQTTTKSDEKGKVTADDIDKVKQQIDQNMSSLSDSKDFTLDDLSTQKMGGL